MPFRRSGPSTSIRRTSSDRKAMNRTFSESLRFPAPDKPVRIVLKKRDPKNAFQEIWTFDVDPADKFRSQGDEPNVLGVAALSGAGQARADRAEEARPEECLSGDLDLRRRSGGQVQIARR